MNSTGCISLDRIGADPRVLDIVREGGVTSDARFVYTLTLARGWQADGCHYPCESSVSALVRAFKRVAPCRCPECQEP